jgi:drug/metabolite transporter (DMT)-like permease
VSAGALALALGAAFLHALWNVLLAGARDTAAATGGLLVYGVLLLAVPAALTGDVSPEAVPFIAASAALELGYFLLLARAYRDGELSVVYPVARGVAPALVLVVASTAGLGKGVGALGAAGVLLVVAGVLLVSSPLSWIGGPGEQLSRTVRRDLAFGLAIAAVIAAYTLVDSEGVQRAEPIPYLALLVAPCALLYPLAARTRPDLSPRTALTAAATFGAFLMVLAAFRLAPAAPVAAVRESSVVIATFLAAVFLKERVTATRAAGAATVVAGIAAIAYS